MNCPKCGKEVAENWKFCLSCNAQIAPLSFEQETPISSEIKKDNEIKYIIVFFTGIAIANVAPYITSFFMFLFNRSFNNLASIMILIGILMSLIAIITGKIRHPKNKAIKVLFWLTIYFIIIGIIGIIVIIAICNDLMTDCYMR